jgi:hypothetical protein
MGTTFVSLKGATSEDEIGFWMRDGILELWLRLLALHVPEPTENHFLAYEIRNQWLLASRYCFNGCVPHGLEDATATVEGRGIVRAAIDSLMRRLENAPTILDANTLNLLGFEQSFTEPFETSRLIEIGRAFIELLDGKITCTVRSTDFMPGSK